MLGQTAGIRGQLLRMGRKPSFAQMVWLLSAWLLLGYHHSMRLLMTLVVLVLLTGCETS